ncbi:MmgE/PrpD family protein [Blastococcus deserti]|uniref:MmgE/PrpD family protein n=1 Tax=Blastococcus deserti TaxID=2259033 RepID=A0ABW4XCA7_9ACTN
MTALGDAQVAAIGRFAAGTRLDDVPEDVVGFARLLLVDTLGALLGGLRYPPVRELSRAVADGAEAGPVPFGLLLTLGTAATWLDADSGGSFHPQGHRLPPVPTAHPAPHSLPVLLHAAAATGMSDRRLLEIFVVANEVGLRSGTASSLRPGLHPHGVHGPAAAALAGVLARGGGAAELSRAFLLGSSLPLAATLAAPMHGATVRNVWTGLGSWYGALASELASSAGDDGAATYSALFDSAVCTELSVEQLVGDLGSRWELVNSYLKPYACARWIHPALDAVLAATSSSGVRGGDVRGVAVHTFAFAASLDAVEVRSDMHARFSLPYSVAALLTDGVLDAGSFLPEQLSRAAVAGLARRVTVHEDPRYTAALPMERPARVEVRTADGRTLSTEVRNARGNPATPLSREEVVAKFRGNVGAVVEPSLTEDVLAALLDPDGSDTSSVTVLARRVLALLAGG